MSQDDVGEFVGKIASRSRGGVRRVQDNDASAPNGYREGRPAVRILMEQDTKSRRVGSRNVRGLPYSDIQLLRKLTRRERVLCNEAKITTKAQGGVLTPRLETTHEHVRCPSGQSRVQRVGQPG